MDIQDMASLAGMVLVAAGVVGTWREMRVKIAGLEERTKKDRDTSEACAALQATRYAELNSALQGFHKEIIQVLGEQSAWQQVTRQKLDDFIRWSRANGNSHAAEAADGD